MSSASLDGPEGVDVVEIHTADDHTRSGDDDGDHSVEEGDAGLASAVGMRAPSSQEGLARSRYAKFTAEMDVLLLEALRIHNPFIAKHGTRLQMWQQIAQTVGEELHQNPESYSWHSCRDRVSTLMKLYAEGKHDKLFKHGTAEANARKEAILRELELLLQRRSANPGGFRTLLSLDANSVALSAATAASSSVSLSSTSSATTREARPIKAAPTKRRRLEGNGARAVEGMDSETFRARVLELIETKIQFDMEQRSKENELREQEFELQKRFLEYLQSK